MKSTSVRQPSAARPSRKRRSGGYAPDETRRALVNSALALFEANGYHVTTVEELVEHAGLTKGAFYHHFASKEDVLRVIHDDYLDASLERARAVLETPTPAREQLRELIAGAIVDIERYRSHVAVFLQEGRFLTGERLRQVKERRDEVDSLYTSVIQRGIADGEFSSRLNPRLMSFAIIGMCAWVLRWYQPGKGLRAEEIADQFSELVLGGLDAGDHEA